MSRAIGVDDIDDAERQLTEVCKSTKLTICGPDFWDYSVLDGMMLSDGGLEKCDRSKNARFGLSCKHEEFARKFSQLSGSFPWTDVHCRMIYDKRTDKTYASWRLRSLSDERLTKEYFRWYTGGKKIVPRDLTLDSVTLTWWYLGDGHLVRKKSRPNFRQVILCTEGFSDEDIDFLETKLSDLIGDDGVYIENRNIVVAKKSLCRFIQTVGMNSPVKCYQYKFEFGPYVDEDYWANSFAGSRNPKGRPSGATDKRPRKRRNSLSMKEIV